MDEDFQVLEKGVVRCNVCNISLTSIKMYDEHSHGKSHTKKKAELALVGTCGTGRAQTTTVTPSPQVTEVPSSLVFSSLGSFPLSSPGEYTVNPLGVGRCHLCEIDLSSLPNTKQHLEGKKHVKKKQEKEILSRMAELELSDSPCGDERPTADASSSTPCQQVKPDSYWCDICRVPLNTPEQLRIHKASDRHKKREQNYVEASTPAIYPLINPCPWYCGFCNKKMNTGEQLRIHLTTTFSHKVLTPEQIEEYVDKGAPRDLHADSKFRPTTLDEDFYKSLEEESAATGGGAVLSHDREVAKFTCDICQVKVTSPEEMQRHIEESHETRNTTGVRRRINTPSFHVVSQTGTSRNLNKEADHALDCTDKTRSEPDTLGVLVIDTEEDESSNGKTKIKSLNVL